MATDSSPSFIHSPNTPSSFPPLTTRHQRWQQHSFSHAITYFDDPVHIVSDTCNEFTITVWSDKQYFLGCSMIPTSSYYPQGNSLVERVHKTINNVIKATFIKDTWLMWLGILPSVNSSLTHLFMPIIPFDPIKFYLASLPSSMLTLISPPPLPRHLWITSPMCNASQLLTGLATALSLFTM